MMPDDLPTSIQFTLRHLPQNPKTKVLRSVSHGSSNLNLFAS